MLCACACARCAGALRGARAAAHRIKKLRRETAERRLGEREVGAPLLERALLKQNVLLRMGGGGGGIRAPLRLWQRPSGVLPLHPRLMDVAAVGRTRASRWNCDSASGQTRSARRLVDEAGRTCTSTWVHESVRA
eukprot:3991613-Pleurochrysis_carterae.AAC.2